MTLAHQTWFSAYIATYGKDDLPFVEVEPQIIAEIQADRKMDESYQSREAEICHQVNRWRAVSRA